MSIRVACPFCNSSTVLPARPATGRAACPRCGETFPVKDAEEVDESPVAPATRGADSARSERPLPSGRAFLLSLAVAAALLAVGLYVYWPFGPPPPPPRPPDTAPPGTIPPPALAGLRYLPAGANVVFAVQPGPLLAYAERTRTDPKALLAAAGVPAEAAATLDRLGVPLDQIDHAAGGLTVTNDSLVPGFALVLRLRRPVADEEQFLQALRAEKKPKAGRPTYSVTLGLPLTMTRADDRTYLFGLREADLAAADPPAEPALPRDLREALADRLSPASFAWVATDADRWAEKAVVRALAANAKDPAAKERFALLGRGRQAAVGLALEPDPRLRVAVRAADADTGKRLRDDFAAKLAGGKAAVGGAADWAEADVPIDPAAGGDVVRKLLGVGN